MTTLTVAQQILPHEKKKRKKTRKIFVEQITNEQLKKDLQTTKNLSKSSTCEIN